MATSLAPYARELAEQAASDTARLGRGIRSKILTIVTALVGIIMVGVLLKFFHLTILVWTLAFVAIIYTGASLIGYALALTAPVWIVNFVRGILGEENNAPEGVAAANSAVNKLWRIWLWAMSYSAVALEIIALWNIEDNMFLVIPILVVGLLVILLAVVLFQESMFFPWLMFWVNCLLLITMLSMALPGNAGITVTRWVDQARTATKAHKAEDNAKRAAEEAINAQRATCFASITEKAKGNLAKKVAPIIPTQADFAQCEKIGVEETPGFHWSLPASKPDADAAQQQSGAASKTAPAAPTAAAAQQPDPACTDLIREVLYSPGMSLGGVNLGPVTSGRYQILVTGDIEQAFLDTDGKVTMYCPISPEGKLGACRTPEGRPVGNVPGRPWTDLPAPPAPAGQLLVPGEAYGAAVVHMLEKPLMYYPRMFVEVADRSHLVADSNVYQNPANYKGTGGRKYQIYKCSSAST